LLAVFITLSIENVHGFQTHIIQAPNSLIRERYKGLVLYRNFDDRTQGGIPDLTLRPQRELIVLFIRANQITGSYVPFDILITDPIL
jgi:hypothetical protein